MRFQTLFQVWLAITAAILIIVWLLEPRTVLLPCAVAVFAATTAFTLFTGLAWRRLARYMRRLENYTAALPASHIELPEGLPTEFLMLASALHRTSEHVSSLLERGTLELTRRETILAGMAEGVLAVDQDLRVTFCNEAFSEAFRTRHPILADRPLYEIVREPALQEILHNVVTSGKETQVRVRLPAAGGRWFEVRALPMGNGPCTGAIMVLHDITEMQRQEQARKDFVANVSHELRTPLASIRGYAETLLDGALEEPGVNRKFVEIIQSHAIRLNNIASDLLALSELDAHAPETAPVLISISEVIDSAVRTVEANAAMHNVELRVNRCEQAYVMGNRLRLEQILVNLLDNAVKFNRPSGSVEVECSGTEKEVKICISDTGLGIPSEDLKRIFERFYRVDKARSRRVGGTGLGLSIVRESLERMNGSVTVESQLGRGSRFTVQMPAAWDIVLPSPERERFA